MKSSLSFRLHSATWLVALILTLVPFFNGSPAEQITGNILATLYWMAVYYFYFKVMVPRILLPGKIYGFFGISIVLLIILPFFGYTMLFLSRALFKGDFIDFYSGYSLPMHFSGFKAMALAGVYGSFFRIMVEYFK